MERVRRPGWEPLAVAALLLTGAALAAFPERASDALRSAEAPPPAPAAFDAPSPGASPTAWHVTALGCEFAVAHVPVERAWADERVPQGFRAQPFMERHGTAAALFVIMECPRAFAPGMDHRDHLEAFLALAVTPPPAYRADGIESYRVTLRHSVAWEDLARAYEQRRVPATMGILAVDATGVPPQGTWVESALRDDVVDVRAKLAAASLPAPPAGTQRFFFAREGGVEAAVDLRLEPPASYRGGAATVLGLGEPQTHAVGANGFGSHAAWDRDTVALHLLPVALPRAG